MKILTNNTELIRKYSKLGPDVCYFILQELATECSYRTNNLQENDVLDRFSNEVQIM